MLVYTQGQSDNFQVIDERNSQSCLSLSAVATPFDCKMLDDGKYAEDPILFVCWWPVDFLVEVSVGRTYKF